MINLFDISLWTSWPTIIIITLISIYSYSTRKLNYWKNLGVNGPKPLPFVGNLRQVFSEPMCVYTVKNYRKYGRIHGLFQGSKPVLSVGEPELIKDIMVKDFNKFIDRGRLSFGDPIFDRSILLARGEEWKKVRTLISPAFSSGKMKKMQFLIEDCVQNLEKVLIDISKDNKNEINIRKIMVNYTMDVISSCAFGTKIDTHNDPDNPFVKSSQVFFTPSLRFGLFFFMNSFLPSVVKKIRLSFVSRDTINYFKSLLRTIIAKRETEPVSQMDFLQIMIDARDKTDNRDIDEDIKEDIEKIKNTINKKDFNIEEIDILATSLLFILAGYETTASTLSYLFHELSMNPDCQQRLYDEIIKYNRNIDYESIAKMDYLDACVSETLRMYSPLVSTSRIANQEYSLGDTGLVIPEGMQVYIPIYAIHRDPEFYPNPEEFNPNRFMPENRDQLRPYTYLPFGTGPRNCVGLRFALLNIKTAVVNIVTKFKFVRTENTKTKLEYKKMVVFTQAIDMGTVRVVKRN